MAHPSQIDQESSQGSSPLNGAGKGIPNHVNGGQLVPSAASLIHNPGLSTAWSAEEQSILELGLRRFALESAVNCYALIAYQLENKTIRDVALRCRWMSEKSSSRSSSRSSTSRQLARDLISSSGDGILCNAVGGGAIGQLMEQNAKSLQRISTNFEYHPYLQEENKILFRQIRQNFIKLLKQLEEQMPSHRQFIKHLVYQISAPPTQFS